MDQERWRRVEAVFLEAIEFPEDQRDDFVAGRCGSDVDLRQAVMRLIDADGQASSWIEAAVAGGVRDLDTDLDTGLEDGLETGWKAGQRVGPYEILSVLGDGGMGIVYRARRCDNVFRKDVAIKVVKRGMDTTAVLRRFHQERRLLARLEHPYIARILDGASTDDGLPYLVMEYVAGTDLLAHCRAAGLGLRDRLTLFLKVCEAIEHAHRNLVVHRDLKPSNILVDAEANPRLLDFGIARLLEGTNEATLTMAAVRPLTPRYASPEQVLGEPVGVASDVYSLGILLFELLTECPAYRIDFDSPTAMLRAVVEEEVRSPSLAARTALLAGGEIPVPVSKLKGDLDRIVLMALEKDPRARYGSVQMLADDLRRHLDNRPVFARPQTIHYRTRKFVRRHKFGMAATALVFLTLNAGIVATSWQAQRAERRFQEVRQLANTFMFEFHDEIRFLPGATKARALLVETALRYLDGLAREAGNDAALLTELAVAYLRVGDVLGDPRGGSLGRTAEAMESYRKSLAIAEALKVDHEDPAVLRALTTGYFKVGDMLSEGGTAQDGIETLKKSLVHAESLVRQTGDQKDQVLLGNILARIGDAHLLARDVPGALDSYRRALDLNERRAAEHPSDNSEMGVAMSHMMVGGALARLGDLAGAFTHYSSAIEAEEHLVTKEPSNAFFRRELKLAYNWMGDLRGGREVINQGDPAGALDYYRRALVITEALVAADPANGYARHDLAVSQMKMGEVLLNVDSEQSIGFQEQALQSVAMLLESSPQEFRYLRLRARCLTRLAMAVAADGDLLRASELVRDALDMLKALQVEHPANRELDPDLDLALQILGEALSSLGKTDEALMVYGEAARLAEAASSAVPSDLLALWRCADSYERLGGLHARLAAATDQRTRWAEAQVWYARSLERWREWNRWGTSSAFNETREARVLEAMLVSEQALAALRASE